jgi:hypothetical protein
MTISDKRDWNCLVSAALHDLAAGRTTRTINTYSHPLYVPARDSTDSTDLAGTLRAIYGHDYLDHPLAQRWIDR